MHAMNAGKKVPRINEIARKAVENG